MYARTLHITLTSSNAMEYVKYDKVLKYSAKRMG